MIYGRYYDYIHFTRRCTFTIFNLTIKCTYAERFTDKTPMIFFPSYMMNVLDIHGDSLCLGSASSRSNRYYINSSKDGFSELWGPNVSFSYDGSDVKLVKELLEIVTDYRYTILDMPVRTKPTINDYKNDNYEVVNGIIYAKLPKTNYNTDMIYLLNPQLYSCSFWDYYINHEKFELPQDINVIIYDSNYKKFYNARTFEGYEVRL